MLDETGEQAAAVGDVPSRKVPGWRSPTLFSSEELSVWFCLIARCTMARVAPFALLLPVFALILSVLFLSDRMTPTLAIGALLAISGVAITQVRPIARPNST
jgi:hypothetical protein